MDFQTGILYCIRHGESSYNAEGRVQGQSDVPLSQLGRRQSEALAQALEGLPVEAIYSSPLKRAMETAESVSQVLGLEICTDPRLKEINAGRFQDKLRSDLEQQYPEDLAKWLSGDLDFVIPGGESRRQLRQRGCQAMKAIARTGHGHVVVVAHGRLLVVTLEGLVEIPEDKRPFALDNGSITRLSFNSDGHFQLVSLNEVDHLDGVGRAGQGDL